MVYNIATMETLREDQNSSTSYIQLSEEHKQICDGSYQEVVLYYLVNPGIFLTHVYETLSSWEWKFYFKLNW